jgi:hypothetical protein
MRRFLLFTLAIAVLTVSSGVIVLHSKAESTSLHGDYVEVRTASVFTGACHYNGEVVSTGRDALMAWSVTAGQWNGVDLTGVRVMAIVSSDANLADNGAARNAEIIINSEASRAQAVAMLDALKARYAVSLGKIVAVRSAPLTFQREGTAYSVNAGDLASINVEPLPNDLCCKMPNLVWYSPLVSLEGRKVGYTTNAQYGGKTVSDPWQRSGENSAFYGRFAM